MSEANIARSRLERERAVRSAYEEVFSPILIRQPKDSGKYDEISFERTGCYGTCPAFKMTLSRHGAAHFDGYAFARRIGSFDGQIAPEKFSRLSNSIESLGFSGLSDRYVASETDQSTAIVALSGSGGGKSVSDYGNVGPIELWLIEMMLDRIADEIAWTTSKQPNHLLDPTSRSVTPPAGAGGAPSVDADH